ncbi:MAG: penicillin acylase family protein, partial [Longimicrobiales bacterium]
MMLEMLIRTRMRPLVVALALGAPVLVAPAAAQESTTLDVAGLQHPVEILVDRWGISHIYADTEYDLFFA